MTPRAIHFEVDRGNLRRHRFDESPVTVPAGQVLLQIDHFALTANNITYAVFGDAMAYWSFFPAAAGWGRIPVWGHATVAESKHDAIKVGERIYGYLPMSTHLVVAPDKVTDENFMDGSAHRRPLPAVYQHYARCARDPLHDPAHEDFRALMHPLFFTSWLAADFLTDNALFGARQIVLASASSKTALGIAFLLGKNRGRSGVSEHTTPTPVSVIGLTSPGNKAFCEKVGYYDQVVTYDALESLAAKVPTLYVDMAGDGKLLARVHHHFGDNLKYSCIIGATHWENRSTQHQLAGAKPQFFFAPTQVAKRRKDWGPGVLERRLGETWRDFLPSVKRWLQVRHSRGHEACRNAYQEVVEGRAAPATGHILALG